MKTILRTTLLVALVLVMTFSLASCGGRPSGTYSNSIISLTFDGSTVTARIFGNDSLSISGEYELNDDNEIVITWEDNDASAQLPTGLTYNQDEDQLEYSLIGATFTLSKSES